DLTDISALSLHDALPIFFQKLLQAGVAARTDELQRRAVGEVEEGGVDFLRRDVLLVGRLLPEDVLDQSDRRPDVLDADRRVIERSEEHTSELQSLAYLVC